MLHFHILFHRCYVVAQKMGRKKIQISRILDQRNRQVRKHSTFTQKYQDKECELDLFCMVSFILLVKYKINI